MAISICVTLIRMIIVAYSMAHKMNLGSHAILIFYVVDGPCMLIYTTT